MTQSDDLGKLWTPPKLVGFGAILIVLVGGILVVFFAGDGKMQEALLVATSALCLLVVGLMDMLAEVIRSTRRVADALKGQGGPSPA